MIILRVFLVFWIWPQFYFITRFHHTFPLCLLWILTVIIITPHIIKSQLFSNSHSTLTTINVYFPYYSPVFFPLLIYKHTLGSCSSPRHNFLIYIFYFFLLVTVFTITHPKCCKLIYFFVSLFFQIYFYTSIFFNTLI